MSVPKAFAVAFGVCEDPKCSALHIISLDSNDNAVMDTAISPAFMPMMIELLQDHLYAINAQND